MRRNHNDPDYQLKQKRKTYVILDSKGFPMYVDKECWETWIATANNLSIAIDKIEEDVTVSTAFIGVTPQACQALEPYLFETTVFSAQYFHLFIPTDDDLWRSRYYTRDRAIAGHKSFCVKVLDRIKRHKKDRRSARRNNTKNEKPRSRRRGRSGQTNTLASMDEKRVEDST